MMGCFGFFSKICSRGWDNRERLPKSTSSIITDVLPLEPIHEALPGTTPEPVFKHTARSIPVSIPQTITGPEPQVEHTSTTEPTPEPTSKPSRIYKSFQTYFVSGLKETYSKASFDALHVTGRLQVGTRQAFGGTADVFDGLLTRQEDDRISIRSGDGGQSTKVAVKVFRPSLHMSSEMSDDELHSIARELLLSTGLAHRNVLKSIGFSEYNGLPALVSEWMENGNLIQYLIKNSGVNRLGMATEVAHGLEYLHKEGIVHADLKGANILINPDGIPMLSDLGVSRLVSDGKTVTGTKAFKFTVNWLAIELVIPSDTPGAAEPGRLHTMKSDIWALGMVFYEVLALKVPFYGSAEAVIASNISKGELPQKPAMNGCPSEIFDRIWRVCGWCWSKIPEDRPTITDVILELEASRVELPLVQEFKAHPVGVNRIECIAFSPVHDRTFATASDDKTACIWTLSEDGKTATRRHQLSGHTNWVYSVAWSRDGLFLVSGSVDETVRKWNTSTGGCELVIGTPNHVFAVALSPDGKHVVSGGSDGGCINVWDATTGAKVLGPLQGHTDNVYAITYAPDGRFILSGSFDKSIICWDSSTGAKLFGPLTVHSGNVTSISFHPSSEFFVTGSTDKTITIWDTNTFQPIHKNLNAHADSVRSAHYSFDGRFVLSASDDGSMIVWDAKRGRSVSNSGKHGKDISSVASSSGGRWVASGFWDGVIKILEFRELDAL